MRALSVILLLSLGARTASADSLLEKMRAFSAEGPAYAYDMNYDDGSIAAAGRVDPTKPVGQRIVVTSPPEAAWSDDFRNGLAEMDAETKGDIWCSDFAANIPGDAKRLAETPEHVSYVFTPEPDADADKNEKKVFKRLKATALIDATDGAVLSYRMSLPKPFKPMMVAKIDTFDMNVACARAPDGRTYVRRFELDIAGSAMMQAFDERIVREITALHPLTD